MSGTFFLNRNGQITRYEYDNLNRQTAEIWQETTVGDKVKSRYAFYSELSGDPEDNIVGGSTPKQALLPGETSSMENYIGGHINGFIIDTVDVGSISGSDFEFRQTSAKTPGSWSSYSPSLTVNVYPGEGKDGSDRVVVEGFTIRGVFLEITVKANANTNLSTPDVFYFSNLTADFNADGTAIAQDFRTAAGADGRARRTTSTRSPDAMPVTGSSGTKCSPSKWARIVELIPPLYSAEFTTTKRIIAGGRLMD